MVIKTKAPSSRPSEPGNGVQNSFEDSAGCVRAQELLTVAFRLRSDAKTATSFDKQVELAQGALIAEREIRRHHSACQVCLAEEA